MVSMHTHAHTRWNMCLVVNIFTLLYSSVCLSCAQTEGFHLQAHAHAHLHMHVHTQVHIQMYVYMDMPMAHESTCMHACCEKHIPKHEDTYHITQFVAVQWQCN